MAIEAETDDTAIHAALNGTIQCAVWRLHGGLDALVRLADVDPPGTSLATEELLSSITAVAEVLRGHAERFAVALDDVHSPAERLALLRQEE